MDPSSVKTATNGTVFHEESRKLYIFRSESIEVMRAWPNPIAWKKTHSYPRWVYFRPEYTFPSGKLESKIRRLSAAYEIRGQLLLPFFKPKEEVERIIELNWVRWFTTVPMEIRNILSRFRDRQWYLLVLLARCGPAAMDLVRSNPALAYALASNWVFHKPPVKKPLRSVRALLNVGKNQRDILAWLGFPHRESHRKLLMKINPIALTITSLLYLRKSMEDECTMKALRHLDQLNTGVIRIATDPHLLSHVTPTFLQEISALKKENRNAKTAHVLMDSIRMFQCIMPEYRKFPMVRSLGKLNEIHESLLHDLKLVIKGGVINIPFPKPPVEGTEHIIPITNSRDLVEEGRIQKNCVASYLEDIIIDRSVYIYRVLSPERCTLSLERKDTGLVIDQLKQSCNKPASFQTHQQVRKWLMSHLEKIQTGPRMDRN